MIDIVEFEMPEDVLKLLLKDHTTGRNIVWGTDQYGYAPDSSIEVGQIISGDVIKPRVFKTLEDQKSRTNSKAEVFTPLEIIKKMNDQVDEGFSGDDIDYITRKVLEVTCGEAPYLVSRYDVSTGLELFLNQREGLLDRKMRRVSGFKDNGMWMLNAELALRSTYGYEWQGDSLLLARENVLYDIIDWYEDQFLEAMDIDDVKNFADIISHNIIQMDCITMCVPYTGIPAKIMDWGNLSMERFDGKAEELTLW